MQHGFNNQMTVESELHSPAATVQVVTYRLAPQADGVVGEETSYLLNMSLTPRPRNARACYYGRWHRDQFERLGDVFLVPPGFALRAMSDGALRQRSLVCQFPQELVHSWWKNHSAWTQNQLVASLDITEPAIAYLLRRLTEEAQNPGYASEAFVDAATTQLTIELGRYFARASEQPPPGGLAAWRLRLIDDRLAAEVGPPSLSELAQLCSISIRQLTRGFRTSRGCSLGEFLATSRMERAKRMLADGATVQDVARGTGFASTSSFTYAFRTSTGQTPRQFQRGLISTRPMTKFTAGQA
jgi:AraC family transcriptional regulator